MKNWKRKAFVFSLAVVMCVGLSACKKEEEQPVQETNPPVEEEIVVNEEKNEEGLAIVDITDLTKDEYVDLTWEQVRDFVENRLPNYREIYSIPEDKVMEQADWENLKKIIFWQLYEQSYDAYVKNGEIYHDVEIVEDEYGTDWIYINPTKEYIESLSGEEFIIYLKNFYLYHEILSEEDLATFDQLNPEQIEEVRKFFMQEQLGEDNGMEILEKPAEKESEPLEEAVPEDGSI